MLGKKVGIYFPNQDGRGGHINIGGVGVTKKCPEQGECDKIHRIFDKQ